MNRDTVMMAAAGLAVGLLALLIMRRGAALSAGQAVGQAVTDGAAGVVIGIGTGIGIPATDADQCDLDIAAGRMWDASFSCPAKRYLAAVFG